MSKSIWKYLIWIPILNFLYPWYIFSGKLYTDYEDDNLVTIIHGIYTATVLVSLIIILLCLH